MKTELQWWLMISIIVIKVVQKMRKRRKKKLNIRQYGLLICRYSSIFVDQNSIENSLLIESHFHIKWNSISNQKNSNNYRRWQEEEEEIKNVSVIKKIYTHKLGLDSYFIIDCYTVCCTCVWKKNNIQRKINSINCYCLSLYRVLSRKMIQYNNNCFICTF